MRYELRVEGRPHGGIAHLARAIASLLTCGIVPESGRTWLRVYDTLNGRCVAQADFGHDADGVAAAAASLEPELRQLGLEEFCNQFHFDRF